MATSPASSSPDRPPTWLSEAADVFAARRRLATVTAVGLVVLGAVVSLVSSSILPPRPVVGAAVGIAAVLLSTALVLAMDAADLTVRGSRHVRAAGGAVALRLSRDHDDIGPLLDAMNRHKGSGATRIALAPASRSAAVPGPRATALAEEVASRGRKVLLIDLARGGSPAAGLSDVVAGDRRLGDVVRFDEGMYLARLAVGADPDGAIHGFGDFVSRLPPDLEVLVAAMPPLAEPGVLRAVESLDLTFVLVEVDRTERVDLIASLDAMDAVHLASELVLIDAPHQDTAPRQTRPAPRDDHDLRPTPPDDRDRRSTTAPDGVTTLEPAGAATDADRGPLSDVPATAAMPTDFVFDATDEQWQPREPDADEAAAPSPAQGMDQPSTFPAGGNLPASGPAPTPVPTFEFDDTFDAPITEDAQPGDDGGESGRWADDDGVDDAWPDLAAFTDGPDPTDDEDEDAPRAPWARDIPTDPGAVTPIEADTPTDTPDDPASRPDDTDDTGDRRDADAVPSAADEAAQPTVVIPTPTDPPGAVDPHEQAHTDTVIFRVPDVAEGPPSDPADMTPDPTPDGPPVADSSDDPSDDADADDDPADADPGDPADVEQTRVMPTARRPAAGRWAHDTGSIPRVHPSGDPSSDRPAPYDTGPIPLTTGREGRAASPAVDDEASTTPSAPAPAPMAAATAAQDPTPASAHTQGDLPERPESAAAENPPEPAAPAAPRGLDDPAAQQAVRASVALHQLAQQIWDREDP